MNVGLTLPSQWLLQIFLSSENLIDGEFFRFLFLSTVEHLAPVDPCSTPPVTGDHVVTVNLSVLDTVILSALDTVNFSALDTAFI